MGHLLVQFFMRNPNLVRSAISNLCRGCEKPIFLTSIELWVITACAQGDVCFWLEYYYFIPVWRTCFTLYLSDFFIWNFRKMSRSASLTPEPDPSRVQDTEQGLGLVSVIRKVTNNNDGIAYEATANSTQNKFTLLSKLPDCESTSSGLCIKNDSGGDDFW